MADKGSSVKRDGWRARIRRAAGFALGVLALGVVDLLFYRIPRLFGRRRRPAQDQRPLG
ncbi:MAG: hypothetical protein QME76_08455 [Bacillota bacterium]|nr:hypothetical protein [Bacillota bacterium]